MAPKRASDHDLAARAAAGDAEAFELLATRHWPALVRYARARLGGGLEHLAEDAVQEAAINAMRALRKGVVPPEPRAWLFVIVRNCCADLRRGTPFEAELPEHARGSAPDAYDAVASADRLDRVVHAIDRLPAGQRRMIIGREFEGRTYEQLAQANETSVGAVKSLLVRARRNLAAAPGLYALGAPLAWLHRRVPVLLGGRETGAEIAGAGAAVHGAALATIGAVAVTAIPLAPLERPAQPRGDRDGPRVARVDGSAAAPRPADPMPVSGGGMAPTPSSLLAACAAGHAIGPGIPRAVARRALRELPADIAEYSTCRADLRRAELDAIGG